MNPRRPTPTGPKPVSFDLTRTPPRRSILEFGGDYYFNVKNRKIRV